MLNMLMHYLRLLPCLLFHPRDLSDRSHHERPKGILRAMDHTKRTPKKRITDSRTTFGLSSPYLVSGKIGGGGSSFLTPLETNTSLVDQAGNGIQPSSTLPDNFLANPADNVVI